MTWHAEEGEITLQGMEATVFKDAILDMCDTICCEDNDEECIFGGAKFFDQMTRTQQLASLEKVSHYLFHTTDECLELTAWSEATLASILQQIRIHTHLEIDAGEVNQLRHFLSGQLEEVIDSSDWDDIKKWNGVLDGYESRFLWDMDYENEIISDLPPEFAQQHRRTFGIQDDYYSAIPPDLESEWDIHHATKRIWMEIDGRKKLKMTVTLTVDVPASLSIEADDEGMQTVRGCYPSVILMRDLGGGDADEDNEQFHDFFMDGSETDHRIEELPST